MQSPSACSISAQQRRTAGYTLIEVIFTLALFMAFGGLAVIGGAGSHQARQFRVERDAFLNALFTARGRAIHGVCYGPVCATGGTHGVMIQNSAFVVFQGENFAERDAAYDTLFERTGLAHIQGATEVVFERHSGRAGAYWHAVLTDGDSRSATITVNPEGGIQWE